MVPDAATPEFIHNSIDNLRSLSSGLPSNIQAGKRDDRLFTDISQAPDSDASVWETVNRRFDILWPSNLQPIAARDTICRGQYGMTAVCDYLKKVDWTDAAIPLDLVALRIARVINIVNGIM
jgi:hypothetical protein